MRLIAETTRSAPHGEEKSFVLGFSDSANTAPFDDALLELIYRPGEPIENQSDDPTVKLGYWKIGITVPDADIARQALLANGLDVSEPTQFLDVGYLCHLRDPDGYTIEILQHDFADNHKPQIANNEHKLGVKPTFGQVTLRVADPTKSLDYYESTLGLRLLSRQQISKHGFTLYFLADALEEPPVADVDAVENREWLWRLPYTVLELQHVWGTEVGGFAYEVGRETGFERLCFSTADLAQLYRKIEQSSHGSALQTKLSDAKGNANNYINMLDPDGYSVRFTNH